MMRKTTEYSDTTLDGSRGDVVRKEEGHIVSFDDLCIKR